MPKPNLLLVLTAAVMVASLSVMAAAPVTVDDARAAAAGIRKISGKRLTLYTDLAGAEIDELPAAFEQAFPQWCKYFRVKESDRAAWSMIGFLMKDKARFIAAGLVPSRLPPFEHGFSWDNVLWINEQPSNYYRRHLLLHEGTHGFMNTVLGGCGPMWYMEGMAECLSTHRWCDGRLTMAYMPENREEVPQWGRIRIIQDAVAQRRALKLGRVLDLAPTPRHETEPYAWCWAATTLLDRHPRYRQRFRQLFQFVDERDFNARFHRLFAADWPELCEEWQLMVANLEYGYDVARCAVDFTPGKPLSGDRPDFRVGENGTVPFHAASSAAGDSAAVTIAADRGWQNSGLRLEAGIKYRLAASGRYQVVREPTIWWCEPGGVSIRYYRGRPLGILLASVRPDHPPPDSISALLRPTVIGLGTTLTPTESGTLFLKINDSPGELSDNAGELKVDIRRD